MSVRLSVTLVWNIRAHHQAVSTDCSLETLVYRHQTWNIYFRDPLIRALYKRGVLKSCDHGLASSGLHYISITAGQPLGRKAILAHTCGSCRAQPESHPKAYNYFSLLSNIFTWYRASCYWSLQVVNTTSLVCCDRGGAKSRLHDSNSVLSVSTTNIQPTPHTAKTYFVYEFFLC